MLRIKSLSMVPDSKREAKLNQIFTADDTGSVAGRGHLESPESLQQVYLYLHSRI